MNTPPLPVSDADRRAFERQRAALTAENNNDEGDAAWESTVLDWANRKRGELSTPPLLEWWESKTEPELHRRARALGLLG
jgi:hypothetical protein